MKKKSGKSAKSKSPAKKTYPTDWMDKGLAENAKHWDPLKRLEVAAVLERQVSQLRQFQSAPVPRPHRVELSVTDKTREACIIYAKRHYEKPLPDDQAFFDGAHWVLEAALTMIGEISKRSTQLCRYRDAEDIEDSQLTDSEIEKSLAKWQQERKARGVDDDDDNAGEEWKGK